MENPVFHYLNIENAFKKYGSLTNLTVVVSESFFYEVPHSEKNSKLLLPNDSILIDFIYHIYETPQHNIDRHTATISVRIEFILYR